ncbi:MAG: S-methyl-5-thioribose-1-phosphate isomerase [Gammaproteobacteria bacterium]|nr:S-methyl-5-thioribose-1-phosphate isomerase [Gammaproteobacteria bacterium]
MTASADRAIVWQGDRLFLLDQRKLPLQECYVELSTVQGVSQAITEMVVRGAPAIGVTAAYGVVLAARHRYRESADHWRSMIAEDLSRLAASRPTAVNLSWAIQRMREVLKGLPPGDPVPGLLVAAREIHDQDVAANRRMGEIGSRFIEGPTCVITHCNAGGLATGGYGTALGVIRSAYAAGLIERVYADETRPWLQGARLTAWELHRDGIPVTLLTDGAAANRMAQGGVSWVIVGSDRIAANGDVVNKIGTYGLAVAARFHGVRFMVVAPTSTIDLSIGSGAGIPIEERDPSEVLQCGGSRLGPVGVDAWNPVFDVTPAHLVDVLVTERGVIDAPDENKVAALMKAS